MPADIQVLQKGIHVFSILVCLCARNGALDHSITIANQIIAEVSILVVFTTCVKSASGIVDRNEFLDHVQVLKR